MPDLVLSRSNEKKLQADVDLGRIKEVIDRLSVAVPKILSVLVSRNDGLSLIHTSAQSEATRMAAMTSTAVSLNKRIISVMNAGELTETSIFGTDGQILLYTAGPRAVLAVMTETKANVALINHKARAAAREIADEFSAYIQKMP